MGLYWNKLSLQMGPPGHLSPQRRPVQEQTVLSGSSDHTDPGAAGRLSGEARGGEAEPGRGREFKNHPLPCLIEPERFLTRNREVSITRPLHSLKRLSRHRLHQPPSQLPKEGWGRGRSGEGEEGPHWPGPRSTPFPSLLTGCFEDPQLWLLQAVPSQRPPLSQPPGEQAAHLLPLPTPPTTHTGTSYSGGFPAEFPKTCWNKGCT